MTGSFRLLMATQLGERRASDSGYTEFPVDPFAIATSHDIYIEAKQQEGGISGALILAGDKAAILYSTALRNQGFERFSIAHELGHYFIPGHMDEIVGGGGQHFSRAGFTEGRTSIELEADHFAAGLLMPSRLVRRLLDNYPIGLGSIEQLAQKANVSLTAAAIRAAQCSDRPIAIIVSKGDEVQYGFFSNSFKKLDKRVFVRKGDRLPTCCQTRAFNAQPSNIEGGARQIVRTTLSEWFDNGSRQELDEEIVGLGRYGFSLTVLSSDLLPSDPDEDEDANEEERLENSWTPRFAYGR